MTVRSADLDGQRFVFRNLAELLAKAAPERSGDLLAGVAAASATERVAAQWALAELPLTVFLNEAVVPYEDDEVTRLIIDGHDSGAFAPLAHLTVGELREWLLADTTSGADIARAAPGITPEMAAAVSKLMRNRDLIAAASKIEVVSRFRNTLGLRGRLASCTAAAMPSSASIPAPTTSSRP